MNEANDNVIAIFRMLARAAFYSRAFPYCTLFINSVIALYVSLMVLKTALLHSTTILFDLMRLPILSICFISFAACLCGGEMAGLPLSKFILSLILSSEKILLFFFVFEASCQFKEPVDLSQTWTIQTEHMIKLVLIMLIVSLLNK